MEALDDLIKRCQETGQAIGGEATAEYDNTITITKKAHKEIDRSMEEQGYRAREKPKSVKDKIVDTTKKVGHRVKSSISSVTSTVSDGIETLKTKSSDIWGKLKDKIETKAKEKLGLIEDKWLGVKEKLTNWAGNRWSWIKDKWIGTKDKLTNFVSNKWSWLKDKWTGLKNKVADFISGKWSWIKEKWEGMKRGVLDWFNDRIQTLKDWWKKIEDLRTLAEETLAKLTALTAETIISLFTPKVLLNWIASAIETLWGEVETKEEK